MRKIISLLIILGLTVSSCGSKKKVAQRNQQKKEQSVKHSSDPLKTVDKEQEKSSEFKPIVVNSTEEYIRYFAPVAQDEMREFGIPASITLAQGILESGSGRGELTLKTNNHFGIKCHTGWKGGTAYHDDDEKGECFRKYDDPHTSYRDHSLFLTSRSRYASLFDLRKNDYKGWAKGLRKAGYATDPRYPQKLIALIERYELYRYDDEVLRNSKTKTSRSSSKKNRKQIYVVRRGDTLYSISKRYNTTVEALKRENRLKNNNISIGQNLNIP
ncbi:glucosaminidase domain-containing protein [Sinomicrobium sp.]